MKKRQIQTIQVATLAASIGCPLAAFYYHPSWWLAIGFVAMLYSYAIKTMAIGYLARKSFQDSAMIAEQRKMILSLKVDFENILNTLRKARDDSRQTPTT
jgi:hypothetical protein